MHIYINFLSPDNIINDDKYRVMICVIINEKTTFHLRVSTVSKTVICQSR